MTNPQDVQERIKAHEAEIQRLKPPRPSLAVRQIDLPPIIDLDGPTPRRVAAPRPNLSDLMPLGDPNDPHPPFTDEIMNARISRKFKISAIKAYDGSGDPANHVRTVHKKSLASLMGIVQGEKESLRDYMNRFTKEALKVLDLDDKIAMISLQQGTRDEFFNMSLEKCPPESMLQFQDRAEKYIKVEKSMKKTVVSNEPAGYKKQKTDQEYDAKDKYPRIGKSFDSSSKKNKQPRFTEYERLNAPRSQILMEIKKDKEFKWPKPLREDPEKRDKSRYCRYNKDVGHDTDNCRQLKDEIEYLIRRGKFGRFTKGEEAEGQKRDNDRRGDDRSGNDRDRNPHPRGLVINMISEGPTAAGTTRNSRKAYAREVMSFVGEPSKRSKSEMILEFGDPDLEGLKFPLDDSLVITLIIGNCSVLRVLVDNGASVDILFHDTFIRMGYSDSQLTPSDAPIYKFNHVECKVEGAI
ncbi:uncharacterized protein LOC141686053 [Apium graveolens]|uniref:uncharacterized protein LOC141686053 n=1 Tax=Apium graveolens TaxID=4045 RepID=UPI003D79283E